MNKYQEALNELINTSGEFFTEKENEAISMMQELVDKATPKKPRVNYVIDGIYCFCQKCGHLIIELKMINSINGDMFKKDNAFCSKCGNAIDWSDNDEKK